MPKPEHVAALAQLVTHALVASPTAPKAAEVLYAAIRTHPAVQDAVLAALVEGGRLVEELELSHCPWLRCERDLSGECLDEACRVVTRRRVRLVEPEWRDAQ